MPDATPDTQERDENHIVAERREKLAEWRTTGKAYPNDFTRKNISNEIIERHGTKSGDELASSPIEVRVAGRMMLKRIMGKASFATLADDGGRLQLYIARDGVGEETYAAFKRWDIGDIVGAVGTLFRTRTNELTVHCVELRLLSKSLRPLAEKFHGLADQEQKYRMRYLDLIMNESSRA
ncbi:MAG: lysine--tRNA ligase, partial [Candidatus Accumulibacter sp.]|nr:lysine--tRNA ligase [Accumulibacter sp.]